jgi:hypothetical protein
MPKESVSLMVTQREAAKRKCFDEDYLCNPSHTANDSLADFFLTHRTPGCCCLLQAGSCYQLIRIGNSSSSHVELSISFFEGILLHIVVGRLLQQRQRKCTMPKLAEDVAKLKNGATFAFP